MNNATEVLALLPGIKKDVYTVQAAGKLATIYRLLKAEKANITSATSEPVKYFFAALHENERNRGEWVMVCKNKGIEMDGQHINVETNRATYKFKVPAGTKVFNAFCELLDIATAAAVTEKPQPVQSIVLSADIMHAIKKAGTFSSKDDLRPAMQAVLIKIDGSSLQVVSTDAHRLYMSPSFKLTARFNDPLRILLPALSFKKALPKKQQAFILNVYADETFDLSIYSGKVTNERFPDYQVVVPEYQGTVIFNRQKMIDEINKVIIYSNMSTSQVNFQFNDQIQLHTQDIDFSFESNTAMPYVKKTVLDLKTAFSGNLLLSVLKQLQGENVIMETDGKGTRCVIFTDGTDRILLMPLMFSESLTETEAPAADPVRIDPAGLVKTRRILTNYLEWVYANYTDTFVHVYADRISIRFVTVVDKRVTKGSRLLRLRSDDIACLLPELHTIAERHGKKLIEKQTASA